MSELMKKPEFWISAVALAVSIGGTGWNAKNISDLKKRVDVIDTLMAGLITKLTPKDSSTFSKVDDLITQSETNSDHIKKLRKELTNVRSRIDVLEEGQAKIQRTLEMLIETIKQGGKDFGPLQQMLSGHQPPYPMQQPPYPMSHGYPPYQPKPAPVTRHKQPQDSDDEDWPDDHGKRR